MQITSGYMDIGIFYSVSILITWILKLILPKCLWLSINKCSSVSKAKDIQIMQCQRLKIYLTILQNVYYCSLQFCSLSLLQLVLIVLPMITTAAAAAASREQPVSNSVNGLPDLVLTD